MQYYISDIDEKYGSHWLWREGIEKYEMEREWMKRVTGFLKLGKRYSRDLKVFRKTKS